MKMINRNNWRLLFTPDVDPYMNMAIDEALTKEYMEKEGWPATIRFYTWKEASCSIGYFQKIEEVFTSIRDKNIPVVRRPTGGGIVYHGNDITFSIIKKRIPGNGIMNITSFYKLIGKSILLSLEELGIRCTYYNEEDYDRSEANRKYTNNKPAQQSFCSATPVKYDIMIDGRKVSGYSARRSQGTALYQGYLDISDKVKDNNRGQGTNNLLWKKLTSSFENVFKITLNLTQLTEKERRRAYEIRDTKYICKSWNYRK